MTGGRVLVVDDDPVLRHSLARLLEEEGYLVDHAGDGVDALARIHESRPDAILLDVLMPRMNGKQLLRALQRSEVTSGIPVVVMTAVSGMMPQHAPVDATFLVEKPFDIEELLNKVALAVYRAGEVLAEDRDDEALAPPHAEPATTSVAERGLILVVSSDQPFLEKVDRALLAGDLTPLSLTRATEDLGRLARVLEPKAVVVDLSVRREEGIRTLEALRREPGLEGVQIVACYVDPAPIEPWRERLDELAAEVVDREFLVDRVLQSARAPNE